MKAYLITTGSLFGLMAAVHVWRGVVEWPRGGISAGFILEMGLLVALPGILSWWAWSLLRKGSRANQDKAGG